MSLSQTANERRIILEDGTMYTGFGFGSEEDKKLELVFNTSMVGYQEIISDPSYTDQAVVMTYPIIGNYGINDDDYETDNPSIGALIVRDYTDEPSNFRCTQTLSDRMKKSDIAGVYGIDTRELTRRIRDYGSCKVMITGAGTSAEEGAAILREWNYRTDQVSRVSTKSIYTLPADDEELCHVVAIDCGIKKNILRCFTARGCKVSVVPYDTDAQTIESLKPDGVFISNGPGDPEDVKQTIETIRNLHGRYPIFGICLGHQILALSYGAKTYKLKFGHRGGNHPVKTIDSGRVDITSQNHSYAVDSDSLTGTGLIATHINLLDDTIEGIRHESDQAFGIQYHPESAPGPNDSHYLFSGFMEMMNGRKN